MSRVVAQSAEMPPIGPITMETTKACDLTTERGWGGEMESRHRSSTSSRGPRAAAASSYGILSTSFSCLLSGSDSDGED